MNKKIITITAIFLALVLAQSSFAASGTVPKTTPLQPVNQPEIFDFTANVNSDPSSPFYQDPNVTSEVKSEPETNPNDTQTNPDPQTPANSVASEPPPTTTYWILLFVGLLGLIGAGIWVYVRFIR